MNVMSSQNASLKRLRALYKDKKLRSEEGVFIAEGVNLVKDIPTDYSVVSLFIKESKESDLAFLEEKFDTEAYIVKDGLFDAVADQVTPSGVIALVAKQGGGEIRFFFSTGYPTQAIWVLLFVPLPQGEYKR